jgi:predicted RNA-binding Zn-ribbon protein involved in translation (DUF1610 family)
LQRTGLLYTPSIFTRNEAQGTSLDNLSSPSIFVCPDCGGELVHDEQIVICQPCHRRWAIRDGIYDFKAPLDE